MSTNELDPARGHLLWIAVALLGGIAGALLAVGCNARDVSADEVSAAGGSAIEREVADPVLFSNRKRASEVMREHAGIKQLLGRWDELEAARKQLVARVLGLRLGFSGEQ